MNFWDISTGSKFDQNESFIGNFTNCVYFNIYRWWFLEFWNIEFRILFNVSESHKIKLSIDMNIIWIVQLLKLAEWKIQISHFYKNLVLYAAILALSQNNICSLTNFLSKEHTIILWDSLEPFEIYLWKFQYFSGHN